MASTFSSCIVLFPLGAVSPISSSSLTLSLPSPPRGPLQAEPYPVLKLTGTSPGTWAGQPQQCGPPGHLSQPGVVHQLVKCGSLLQHQEQKITRQATTATCPTIATATPPTIGAETKINNILHKMIVVLMPPAPTLANTAGPMEHALISVPAVKTLLQVTVLLPPLPICKAVALTAATGSDLSGPPMNRLN